MKEITCKLLVIGAGPGGSVCAGQFGIDRWDAAVFVQRIKTQPEAPVMTLKEV